MAEALVWRWSVKNIFLQISQKSQKNNRVKVLKTNFFEEHFLS